METELTNQATILDNYNDIPTEISTQALVVTILTGPTVTKSADKMVWSDGNLTYKLEVNNQNENAYTSPVVTDILNPDLIKLVDNTIKIDGTLIDESEYTYDESTGTLTINLDDIAPSASSTITFQVEKKA